MNEPFLSICIPSYNRPDTLYRLLKSIDVSPAGIEVVIAEDKAPKRDEVREAVQKFKRETELDVLYHENSENLGYDANIRECISVAHGKWVMYMGDDDVFIPGKLSEYISFLKEHDELGYVLRSYKKRLLDGKEETFRYYDEKKFFDPGADAYVSLFRKSVFISGFCFKRELALKNITDIFDGTLLYQLYIQAEICMNYPSAYYDEPFTMSIDDVSTVPYFGSSARERNLYTAGTVTVDNSVNFIRGFFKITEFMDQKYGLDSTSSVRDDMSRYSYPILSIQRKKGRREFKKYALELRGLGLDSTKYFRIYYKLLYVFGEGFCDFGIRMIKKIMGRTPKL